MKLKGAVSQTKENMPMTHPINVKKANSPPFLYYMACFGRVKS